MKSLLFLLFAFLLNDCTLLTEQRARTIINAKNSILSKEISDNWTLEYTINSKSVEIPSLVPGNVHLDLIYNKVINDPFFKKNNEEIDWIEKLDWRFKCTFTIPKYFVERENVQLVFEGLDTHANVFLNGNHILEAHNAFVEWRVNVKSYIVPYRENHLIVEFMSRVKYDDEYEKRLKFKIPTDSDWRTPYSRSPPYHYGWDWQFRAIGAGIWKKVRVEAWNNIKVKYFNIQTVDIKFERTQNISSFKGDKSEESDKSQKIKFSNNIENPLHAELKFDIFLEPENTMQEKIYSWSFFKRKYSENYDINGSNSSFSSFFNKFNYIERDEIPFNLTIISPNSNEIEQIHNLSFRRIDNFTYTFTHKIKNPILWWPNNLGIPYGKQYEVNLDIEGVPTISKKFGIRKVKVSNELDDIGREFTIMVNDISIFVKGTNYVPSDIFYPSIVDHTKLLSDAHYANMNIIRVWGGGQYESEQFYRLCDDLGILIFHDFMFAGSALPGDNEFLENISHEVFQVLMRLKSHPSIALWNGNNEAKEAWEFLDVAAKTGIHESLVWSWFQEIFYNLIPSLIEHFDNGRFYEPSSPVVSWLDSHNDTTKYSDSHYWGLFNGMQPIQSMVRKVPRFMTEYGFQATPDIETFKVILEPEHINFSFNSNFSSFIENHEKLNLGIEKIRYYMLEYTGIPDNDPLEFIYLSQILQSHALKLVIEAHRKEKGYCWGSMYWQLNDAWPVISWSSIDYFGHWKALHYNLRNFYNSIFLVFIDNVLFLINDELVGHEGTLNISLTKFDGKVEYSESVRVSMEPNSIFKYLVILPINSQKNPGTNYFYASFQKKDQIISENFDFFTDPKNLNLPKKPHLKLNLNSESNEIIVKSESFLFYLWIYCDKEYLHLSDNYFHLLPYKEKRLKILNNVDLNEVEIQYKAYNFIEFDLSQSMGYFSNRIK